MNKIPAVILLFILADIACLGQAVEEPSAGVPDVNGRATMLIRPALPADALMNGADGTTLNVVIVVGEDGNVISAQCSTTCPPLLKGPAEKAASESKFAPLIINGKAVRYRGVLIYTFAVERVNWFNFGSSLRSVYLFDNISVGPAAAMLTTQYGEEKAQLLEIDRNRDLKFRWRTIRRVADVLKAKLPASDAWVFSVALALRDVTAPFQADRLDLVEVQKSLIALGPLAESAPKETPPVMIEGLRALSVYKIDHAMPVQELRKEIFQLAMKVTPPKR